MPNGVDFNFVAEQHKFVAQTNLSRLGKQRREMSAGKLLAIVAVVIAAAAIVVLALSPFL